MRKWYRLAESYCWIYLLFSMYEIKTLKIVKENISLCTLCFNNLYNIDTKWIYIFVKLEKSKIVICYFLIIYMFL